MKKLNILAALLVAAVPMSHPLLHAQAADETTAMSPAVSATQQRIDEAQQRLAKDPKRAQPYNELALAYLLQARDTADSASLSKAEAAIHQGLQIDPNEFQLQKSNTMLLLARHRFSQALVEATALNQRVPDDVAAYGYIAEADIALGRYADAETSVQWMLNLRPNNIAGLLLASDLREIYGESAGAIEFLNQAFNETPQVESDQLAWIANRIVKVELASGQLDAAVQVLSRGQALAPESPDTLINLAQLRLEQQKPADAAAVLASLLATQQFSHASETATLYQLAAAQKEAGMPQSDSTSARFVASAEAAVATPANDNVDLILLYANTKGDADKALHLASQEIVTCQDVWMLDAYAWSLYAGGKYDEADKQIQRAIAIGTRSAQIFDHAGEIALKLKKPEVAAQNFASAIQSDPYSAYALAARRQLGAAPQVASVQPQPAAPVEQPQAAPATAPLQSLSEVKDTGGIPTALLIPRPTGTDRIIHKMQARVTAHPTDPSAYSGLGAAFFQRARETGDVEDYQLAEQALNRSLDMVSTDMSATAPLESMAEVCMGEHRFTDALDYAQRALALGSGDVSAFAIVGDAYADMGEYAKAGVAYSRLQPVTAATPMEAREAYAQQARTAYLSFISGNTEDAIHQMQTAVEEGVQAHLPRENLAWLYFELGEFSYQAGRIPAAADAYFTALTIYPGDYRALAGLGKVRASQGKFQEAITLYQSAIAVVPMPLYIAELGDIYAKTGDSADAEKQYKLVQYIGLLGHINQVLHNRDLALFYADHDRNLGESLTLARKEFEVRSDIYTWDALAWSLYKNGKYAEAKEAMSHADRLGTKDPMLLFHAGMIAAKLDHPAAAVTQLKEALSINPQFNVLYAPLARQELDALHAQTMVASGAAAAAQSGKTADVQ